MVSAIIDLLDYFLFFLLFFLDPLSQTVKNVYFLSDLSLLVIFQHFHLYYGLVHVSHFLQVLPHQILVQLYLLLHVYDIGLLTIVLAYCLYDDVLQPGFLFLDDGMENGITVVSQVLEL